MFLRRESSTSSTTRISKMNPSAARRAKRSGRDRQVPARSGQRQQLSVRSAGGKPPFPSNLPRAVRFIAVSASSAGRRKRPRQPGKSLFQTILLGGQECPPMQLPVYSFSHTRVEFVCVYCCSVAAQTPRSFYNSPRNHSASLFSMPLAAVIFAPLCRWMRRSYQTRSPLCILGYSSHF